MDTVPTRWKPFRGRYDTLSALRARGLALAPGVLILLLAAIAVSLAQANGYDMWELSFLLGVAEG